MSHSSYDSFVDIIKQERKAFWIFLGYTLLIILLWDLIDLKAWVLHLQSQHWPWYLGFFFSGLYIVRGFFLFSFSVLHHRF